MTVPAKAQALDPLAGVRRFALEKVYHSSKRPLKHKVDLFPGTYAELLNDQLHELRVWVWGRRDTHVVGQVPATWWDHYKVMHRRRYNPWGWFLRKVTTPPASRHIKLNVTTWLPELRCEHNGEKMTLVNFDADLEGVWEKEDA